MVSSQPWIGGPTTKEKGSGRSTPPEDDEGATQEFYGQLWFVPDSSPSLPRVWRGKVAAENLVWIRRDLWEKKSFGVDDCYLVKRGDTWTGKPQKLSFAESIWGEGKRKSFVRVVKEAMAGRGRGGGGGRRPREEDWGHWGGGWQGPPYIPIFVRFLPHPPSPP